VSYYRPPMGDYKTYGYAGDPGWLSSAWKVIKTVGKAVLGIAPKPGGVVVPVAAGVGGGLIMNYAGPAAPVPGGIPGFGATGGVGRGGPYSNDAAWAAAQGGLPRGYHYAKDGSGRPVRNRRMNVANPRALRKAIRRVQGFEKLAKRTIQTTRRVRLKK